MGVSIHRPLQAILSRKHALAHTKQQKYTHIVSGWRYSQNQQDMNGQPMPFPWKLYPDQGYIILFIRNNPTPSNPPSSSSSPSSFSIDSLMDRMQMSTAMGQLMYSILHQEILPYRSISIEGNAHYQCCIHLVVGQYLNAIRRLGLLAVLHKLQKRIKDGGINQIQRLFHEYDSIVDGESLRASNQYSIGWKQIMHGKTYEEIFCKIAQFQLMRDIYHGEFGRISKNRVIISPSPSLSLYPTVNHEQFIKQQQPTVPPPPPRAQILDNSSPFLCEITEIGLGRENQSMVLMEGLHILANDGAWVSIPCSSTVSSSVKSTPTTTSLTNVFAIDYAGARHLPELQKRNISTIINLCPDIYYNYFYNDLHYIDIHLSRIQGHGHGHGNNPNPNIQCIIRVIANHIDNAIQSNNNHIGILSHGNLFSQELFAVLVGLLIMRHLLPFKESYQILNQLNKKENKADEDYPMVEVYRLQMVALQERVMSASKPMMVSQIIPSNIRAYIFKNIIEQYQTTPVLKYVGEMSNASQIQLLQPTTHSAFLLLNIGLTQHLSIFIQKYKADPSNRKIFTGLPGMKIIIGKQVKENTIKQIKGILLLILKYEFINRSAVGSIAPNIINALKQLIDNNCLPSFVEKSFRKPSAFLPVPYTTIKQVEVMKGLPQFNSSQALTFKYPVLRPVWQHPLSPEHYYFILRRKGEGASMRMVKGGAWIGLEKDRMQFCERIVKQYLSGVDQQKINVIEQQDNQDQQVSNFSDISI